MSMGPGRCERHDGSGMHSSAPCTCPPTSYEMPIRVFRHEPATDPPDDRWRVEHLVWVYSGRQCIGSLQLVDGKWESFPLTQVWEGDQA